VGHDEYQRLKKQKSNTLTGIDFRLLIGAMKRIRDKEELAGKNHLNPQIIHFKKDKYRVYAKRFHNFLINGLLNTLPKGNT
jgi:hypothetical protein